MLVWCKNIVLEYDQYISFLIQNEIEWVFKKYSQKAETKNRVASSIINLTSENSELGIEINPVQNENIYMFKVDNTDNEKKSEISMEYILKIQSNNNLPLEFELYENEDTEEKNNLLEGNGNVTEKIVFKWNEDPHNYKLKIKWKENENSYLYAQTIDYVQVVLESVQLD